MKALNWFLVVCGLFLVLFSIWRIQSAAQGVQIVSVPSAQPPLTVFLPASGKAAPRPVVMIGHGFAGSQVVMRGFAFTLAHAGYTVVTWDFDGHGSNPRPLQSFTGTDELVGNAEAALDTVLRRGLAEGGRVAILGHSMGSGVALAYGQKHPDTAATIAVSPVDQPVTADLPHDLLLLAGTAEPDFLQNAQRRLAEAGGTGGDPKRGTARKLVPIPGANHLTILFSPLAQHSAQEWLDDAFGPQPGAVPYTDTRIFWFFIGVLGALLVAALLALRIRAWLPLDNPKQRSIWRRLAALGLGVFAATVALALSIPVLARAGVDLGRSFGLLVGGYLLVWFAVAGVLSLLLLGTWPAGLSVRSVLAALFTFAALWLGVGLLGNNVWQPWLLVSQRLALWPLGVLFLLPWFLAVGELVRGASWLGQLGGWAANSALIAGGLLLAMRLTPGIGFLILIMPVFPAFFALHAVASGPYRGGWPFALSGALFTSWMLLAVFPLTSSIS